MVDFEFSNGYQKSILVEFKLLSNRGLQSDGGLSQIQQYMVSTKTDTAFLVVFGFDEKDAEMVGKIEAAIKQSQMRETDKFIELVYIDAQRSSVPVNCTQFRSELNKKTNLTHNPIFDR